MDGIRAYLLQLLAAAIISGAILRILPGSGPMAALAKLLCSIFLLICAVKPIPKLEFTMLDAIGTDVMFDAEEAVASGENTVRELMAESIIGQTEAYILEKAKEMDIDLAVRVEVSEDDIPMPSSVCLSGKISPYAKTRISDMIAQDLGINKEHQVWK